MRVYKYLATALGVLTLTIATAQAGFEPRNSASEGTPVRCAFWFEDSGRCAVHEPTMASLVGDQDEGGEAPASGGDGGAGDPVVVPLPR